MWALIKVEMRKFHDACSEFEKLIECFLLSCVDSKLWLSFSIFETISSLLDRRGMKQLNWLNILSPEAFHDTAVVLAAEELLRNDRGARDSRD